MADTIHKTIWSVDTEVSGPTASPINPFIVSAMVLLLVTAGGAACLLPAYRAVEVDPVQAESGIADREPSFAEPATWTKDIPLQLTITGQAAFPALTRS